jgi:hypothetical protein
MDQIVIEFYPSLHVVSPKLAAAYREVPLEQRTRYLLDDILDQAGDYDPSDPMSLQIWEYFDELLDRHGALTLDCLTEMLKEVVS